MPQQILPGQGWSYDITSPTISSGQVNPTEDWTFEQAPESWGHWLTNQALRTVPAVGGSILGSALGPWGTAGGGMFGGALGESLSEWYEGRQQNPGLIAWEGLANAIPLVNEFPGAGAGIKQLAKYAGSTALQGGVQGVVGSFPRHWAETGNFEMPGMNEALGEGLGGAAFGGAMGLAHAGGAKALSSLRNIEGPTTLNLGDYIPPQYKGRPFDDMAGYTQPDLDIPGLRTKEPTQLPLFRKDNLPPTGPEGPGGDFGPYWRMGDPMQGELPLSGTSTEPRFNQGGQGELFNLDKPFPTTTTPDIPSEKPASLEDLWKKFGGLVDRDHPLAPDTAAPPDVTTPPPSKLDLGPEPKLDVEESTTPEFVPIKSPQAGEIAKLRREGYVPVPGLVTSDGTIHMARADVVERAEAEASAGEGNPLDILKRRLAQQGPQNQLVGPTDNAWERLRNKLGRNPTNEEMLSEIEAIQARVGARSGEQRGRVAQFDRGWVPDETRNQPPVEPSELQQFLTGLHEETGQIPPRPDDINVERTGEWPPNSGNVRYGGGVEQPPSVGREPGLIGLGPVETRTRGAAGPELTIPNEGRVRGEPTQQDLLAQMYREDVSQPQSMGIFNKGKSDDLAPITTAIKSNVRHNAAELTTGYRGELEGVMAREGVQNALDAIKDMPGSSGKVHIKVVDKSTTKGTPAYLEITDNGVGMSPQELHTVFTTLHESGKTNDPNATGGKGVGKATFMLGGDHFEVVTVKEVNGRKIESRFSGTPEELLTKFQINPKEVPASTPTGTMIKTTLKDTQHKYNVNQAVDNILKYSRERNGEIIHDRHGIIEAPPVDLKGNPNDKLIGKDVSIDGGNTKVDIYVTHDSTEGQYHGLTVHVLNNGMWQFDEYHHFDEAVNGVPNSVIVNLKPQVPELDPRYPFPVQRESVKAPVWKEITDQIMKDIISPSANRKKVNLAKLWTQMKAKHLGGMKRESVIFDPGDRMTADEAKFVNSSKAVTEIQRTIDSLFDEMFKHQDMNRQDRRLIRTGMTMKPDVYGIHIPDPMDPTNRSAALINIFAHLEHSANPREAALGAVTTGYHEGAHVGLDAPDRLADFKLTKQDLQDPRIGEYLQSYLSQVMEQGGLDAGHGVEFVRRLGEIYARAGASTFLRHADALEHIFTGGDTKSGRYSPEIQRVLQIYKESRGRAATTEDILSGTGIKQAVGPNAAGGVPSPNNPNGSGVFNKIKQATGIGQGSAGSQKAAEANYVKAAAGIPDVMMTSLDLSMPGRQGLTQVLTPEFWKGAFRMFGGISEAGYQQLENQRKAMPIFDRPVVNGKPGKSIAEEAGLKQYVGYDPLSKHARDITERWLESAPGVGKLVAGTSRAARTFNNQLAAETFTRLMDEAEHLSLHAIKHGEARPGAFGLFKQKYDIKSAKGFEDAMNLNPYYNKSLARDIADFVNTASGHAPLKTHFLPSKQFEYSLESASSKMAEWLFSPGLLASRVRLMNPSTYMMATPFVRKQYMRSALGGVVAWGTFMTLGLTAAKAMGLEASANFTNPTASDFGKLRIGNAYFDPGGGFNQLFTFANRMIAGGTTDGQGNFHKFGEGFRAPTRFSTIEDFTSNKLRPIVKFAYDVLNASQRKPFQPVDRTAQLFVPLVVQDIVELAKEDPRLLPWAAATIFGVGTQVYGKEDTGRKMVPDTMDVNFTGGGGIY